MGRLRIVLDVAIKARLSAALPVLVLVVVNGGPPAQQAQELVACWTNHDPHMPMPDDEIGRLGMQNLSESGHTVIQIIGVGIRAGKSSALINGVHQMRAITACIARPFGVQRDGDHRRTVASA